MMNLHVIYVATIVAIVLLSSSVNARNFGYDPTRYNMYIGKACRGDKWGYDKGKYDKHKYVTLEWCAQECQYEGWRCDGFEYNSRKNQCEIHTKPGGYFENGYNPDLLCAWKK